MFETVYQISRFPFPDNLFFDIPIGALGILFSYGCIQNLVTQVKEKTAKGLLFNIIGLAICLLICSNVCGDLFSANWSSASELAKAFYSGNYEVTEGIVENYCCIEQKKETFTVDGVDFFVAIENRGQQFKDLNNCIYGNGEYVRISYYTLWDSPTGREILKVEEWKKKE